MKLNGWILLLPIVAMSAVSCGPKGYTAKKESAVQVIPITPENEKSLLPLTTEGNEWVYSLDVQTTVPNQSPRQTKTEMLWRVKRVVNEGTDVKRVIIEILRGDRDNPEGPDEQEWLVTKEGIFQMSMGRDRKSYEPRQPVLLYPVKAESKFTWKGKGVTPAGQIGDMQSETIIGDSQLVDTEQGMKSGVAVNTRTTFKVEKLTGIAANATYFSPGIGIIRYRQEIVIGGLSQTLVLRLKRYKISS